MFFYIIHHIHYYLFKINKGEGVINTRTFIFGSILYILLHGLLYSKSFVKYHFKDYFWWLFVVDIISMGVIYKHYYNDTIFGEVKKIFGKSNKNDDNSINNSNANFNNNVNIKPLFNINTENQINSEGKENEKSQESQKSNKSQTIKN